MMRWPFTGIIVVAVCVVGIGVLVALIKSFDEPDPDWNSGELRMCHCGRSVRWDDLYWRKWQRCGVCCRAMDES